jgi:hypothetical protein
MSWLSIHLTKLLTPQLMVAIQVLTFRPTDVTVICWLNDIRPVDIWSNDVESLYKSVGKIRIKNKTQYRRFLWQQWRKLYNQFFCEFITFKGGRKFGPAIKSLHALVLQHLIYDHRRIFISNYFVSLVSITRFLKYVLDKAIETC